MYTISVNVNPFFKKFKIREMTTQADGPQDAGIDVIEPVC